LTLAGTLRLEAGKEEREGRKTDRHFCLHPDEDSLVALRAGVQSLLAAGELAEEQLRSPDHGVRLAAYRAIVDTLALRPARNLQDVLDFVRHLVTAGKGRLEDGPPAEQGEKA
jgi:hypothetical protein